MVFLVQGYRWREDSLGPSVYTDTCVQEGKKRNDSKVIQKQIEPHLAAKAERVLVITIV